MSSPGYGDIPGSAVERTGAAQRRKSPRLNGSHRRDNVIVEGRFQTNMAVIYGTWVDAFFAGGTALWLAS